MNQVLLIKLPFRILANPNSLLDKSLFAKYEREKGWWSPKTIRASPSPLSLGLNMLKGNITWICENDKSVHSTLGFLIPPNRFLTYSQITKFWKWIMFALSYTNTSQVRIRIRSRQSFTLLMWPPSFNYPPQSHLAMQISSSRGELRPGTSLSNRQLVSSKVRSLPT